MNRRTIVLLFSGILFMGSAGSFAADTIDASNPKVVENFVIPSDGATSEAISEKSAKDGMQYCYDTLYPKGNAYVLSHIDKTLKGDPAKKACMQLILTGGIASSKSPTVAPQKENIPVQPADPQNTY